MKMHYSLANTKSFETNTDSYVIYLSLNESKSQLAVNLSNKSIEILDSKTLQTITQIKDFDDLNPIMRYSPQNSNQLIVCTTNSIKIYDLRHKSFKTSKQFNVLPESELNLNDMNCNQLTCFDLNCDFSYVCAGTEVSDKDRNSYLYFWDIRRPALVLGTYCESHTNDITDLCFHPNRRNVFVSGSADELINVFDLNEPEEEDALTVTLNVEANIDRIYWTKSMENGLICLTRDECVQMWDTEEVVPKVSLNALSADSTFDYAIDVLSNTDLVCVGDKNNAIKVFDINSINSSNEIAFSKCLSDGHNKLVRTVATDSLNSVIYSGGEDGIVCVWNRLELTDNLVQKCQTKGKSKIRVKGKNRSNPY